MSPVEVDKFGYEYGIGAIVLWAAQYGHRVEMRCGVVTGFTKKGNVTVIPEGSDTSVTLTKLENIVRYYPGDPHDY